MKVILVKPYPGEFVGSRNLPPECFEVGWVATLAKCTENPTWYLEAVGKEERTLILEDNKWGANFPAECFAFLQLDLAKVLEL